MNSEKNSGSSRSRYVTFEDELELEEDSFGRSEDEEGGRVSGTTLISDIELVGNGAIGNSLAGGSDGGTQKKFPKRIRLRAVESEQDYFMSLINVQLFRKLVLAQAIASVVTVVSQIVLYAIVTRGSYKSLDLVGIGLWGPVLFFFNACWLTWLTTRSPSGCSIGTAMGLQIASLFVGLLLLLISVISMVQHGKYSYWDESVDYDPEITGRIFCSLIILSAVVVTSAALFLSVMFCKVTCCAKSNAHENLLFDVETV